ncbi:MAG: methionyl-tRNA formyltransferase [Lachnospiraceae bacterium]|nr:methionyl-tRNA formyltransferase [Lachnospiraceae bacterium]
MKVVYMGTPDFAVGALERIIEAGHEVVLVVTQPDKPKGRGKEMQMTPVKKCALEHNIPVFQPVKIKEAEAVAYLRTFEADIFVVAAFGQILSSEILHMPKFGCVNIHASLLPMYRGAAPIQAVIINKEKETGVTIMQMDEGLDTGDMLMKEIIPIEKDETGESLHDKLSELGAKMIVEALIAIENGTITATPQGDGETCYASMLKKEMGCIDWEKSADDIEHLVRGLYPWPGTYTFLNGKMLKICAVAFSDEKTTGEPGEICTVTKDNFVVNTGDGTLEVRELQPEGKKRMTVHDFLLGNKLEPGVRLGAKYGK